MSNLDSLNTAKANVLANLLAITANPKPTYSLDGQTVSWNDYQKMLTDQLTTLNSLIVVESGPFSYTTQGIS